MPLTTDEAIAASLAETRTVAVLGASDRPARPSWGVMRTLQDHGYRPLPVNPQITRQPTHPAHVPREPSPRPTHPHTAPPTNTATRTSAPGDPHPARPPPL